jgi:hypothetical protein
MNLTLSHDWKTNRKQAFNVTIIYEAEADGIHAKLVSDQLACSLAGDRELNLNVWSFRVLGIPNIRNIAASAAAEADIVIFSMSGTTPLPPHTEEWIETWAWLINRSRPGVITLFANTGAWSDPIRDRLHRIAKRKDLDFVAAVCPDVAGGEQLSIRGGTRG